jgi:predicted transglutaminase-like cysteine proteinase
MLKWLFPYTNCTHPDAATSQPSCDKSVSRADNISLSTQNCKNTKPLVLSIILLWLSVSLSYFALAKFEQQKILQLMAERYGSQGVETFTNWQQLIGAQKNNAHALQIEAVNDFFNRQIRFTDDLSLWKKTDYWATPLETMGMGAGDCEDFTIAKYVTLLELGVPMAQLRLIYVKARIGSNFSNLYQAHMVLGYYPNNQATPLILDNLIPSIEKASQRTDLRPIFSFNSEGLWVGNQQALVDPTARLSRWRDLLLRTQQEGFILNQPKSNP